jgi:outer membrane protein assembly factor BamB
MAEDLLCRLAADKAPGVGLGADDASRKKCRDAWLAWWKDNGARADLAKLDDESRLLGYTLVATFDNDRNGSIYELDRSGKELWRMEKMPWPLEVQLLPGGRMLLTEYYDNRVAERDRKGDLKWEKMVPESPISALRMPGGTTFIATTARIMEVDRAGKELYQFMKPNLMAARKLRDGRIACVSAGNYLLCDTTGKELRTFPVGAVFYGWIDVLPNGNVIIPQQDANKVVEFDPAGKEVWSVTIQRPNCVQRLPNGNTLIACRDAQLVAEVDRKGTVVWQHKCATYPWRAHRR